MSRAPDADGGAASPNRISWHAVARADGDVYLVAWHSSAVPDAETMVFDLGMQPTQSVLATLADLGSFANGADGDGLERPLPSRSGTDDAEEGQQP